MAEKKSIGYIPPTPFRDDSDVFILPADGSPGAVEGEQQQAWLAEELEVIRSQRASLRQRNAEIVGAFQLVLNQLIKKTSHVSSTAVVAPRQSAAKVSDNPRTASESAPTLVAPAQFPTASVKPAPRNPSPEPDRLAMLKAQLASRIKSFQNVSHEQGVASNERGAE